MTKEQRAQQRTAYQEKNARRRQRSKTLYAEKGREGRKKVGGAFGHTDPDTFNALSEGTTAMRRAESNLEDNHGAAEED